MNIRSTINKLKRVSKFIPAVFIGLTLSLVSLAFGISNIISLNEDIGDAAVYSQFDLALIPIGLIMLVFFIVGIYFIFTETRWEDRYGGALPLSAIALAGIALVLTFITPSIYESKYEKAGLKACSGTPVGYLPLFAKKYAADPSLCGK
ncbi:hypothetical protein [Vibrio atlanticus]|uniref:DUF2079 domain-containing protein n=1 Tax=Vibrio atlanticus (strain LGP32) TaxID=575788 RepID=B7VS87_VIBA3|nr:hypothetical protein [Vibrio atlanticus]CAV27006.1 Hypothetical protein VS_II1107 [Vibrio atlanticus]